MTSPYTRHAGLKMFAVTFFVFLLCPLAVPAQDRQKIAATKERIHRLADEAERLMERGRVNEAEKLLQEVRKLKNWLAGSSGSGRGQGEDFQVLFGSLKKAIHALKEMGHGEHAEKLAHFTKRLHTDLTRRQEEHREHEKRGHEEREHEEREHDERGEAKRQLQILRYAKGAFAEAGKKEALELIERVMHAREMRLEGRRDREAREIMERAPGREDLVELLGWAAKILAEYGAEEKAAAVKGLAGQVGRSLRERRGGRERERERGKRERERGKRERERGKRERERERSEGEAAEHQLEVIRFAAGVLEKADRDDAAELMEHAAKAMALRLKGARTDSAERTIRTAPNRRQIARMLGLTTEILQDWGQRDRAEMVARVARQFGRGQERERGRERREGRRTDTQRRMEELAERLARLAEELAELEEQVHRLKRQTR